jgi:hypothetical protein
LVNADGSVALRWQPAADAEQTNALTYNLRMGTAPGSNDVWSAEALPDGRKLVPGHGNLGWRTNLILGGLIPGRTYYWSVQAVDASFAGGPFAPEQSFLLVGEPKRVNTRMKRGPGTALEFSVSGQPHVSVRFESSTDLRVWQTVQFLSLDAAGELNFTMSPEVPDGGLFYRLVEIP